MGCAGGMRASGVRQRGERHPCCLLQVYVCFGEALDCVTWVWPGTGRRRLLLLALCGSLQASYKASLCALSSVLCPALVALASTRHT